MLRKNTKIYLNQNDTIQVRIQNWFRDLFNFGWQINKNLYQFDKKFHLVLVLPTSTMSSASIAAGYTCAKFKNNNIENDEEISKEIDNSDNISLIDELKDKKNIGEFYEYKISKDKNPIAVKFLGMEELSMMEASRSRKFKKYNFKRGFVNLFHFENRKDLTKIEPIQETSLDLCIKRISSKFKDFELKPGSQLTKKDNGLVNFFLNSRDQEIFNNKLEHDLIKIYGDKNKIIDDLFTPLSFYLNDQDRSIGKLNDIVRANRVNQYQHTHSSVMSSRSSNDLENTNDNSEIIIFEGSDAYLKLINEHYNCNTIAILTPEDVHFSDSVNIANSLYQRNMIEIENSIFNNFSNKYPCMAYWRKS